MVTNTELNKRRELGCQAVRVDKKLFLTDGFVIRRTLRRNEWQSTSNGEPIIPTTTYPQRWRNEVAVLRFLSDNTNLPLPSAGCTFEDDGAFYSMTKCVEGVKMADLSGPQKEEVMEELQQHRVALQSLRSDTPGVPGGLLLCPPRRVSNQWRANSCWKPRDVKGDYVFCHNDLGQHNIIVDPATLRIKAIIGWEHAGFWPAWFERPFWERSEQGADLESDEGSIENCRAWLKTHCDEVLIPHLVEVFKRQ